jgi:hypothetical protein
LHGALIAAIDHIVEETPIAPSQVEGFEYIYISSVLHQAGSITRRQIEVNDITIRWGIGVNSEPSTANQTLIGTDSAETHAISKGLTPREMQA